MTMGIRFGTVQSGHSGSPPVTPIAPNAIVSATLESWWKSSGSMYTDNPPTTLAGASDPVTTWVDSSGNAYDSVAETSDKPIYNVVSGLPMASFDGTNLEALASGNHAGFSETTAFSLFAIVSYPTVPGAGGSYTPFLGKHDGASGWHLTSGLTSAGKLGIILQGLSYLEVYGSTTTMVNGALYALVLTNSGVDVAGLKMWINGVPQTMLYSGGGAWGSINPVNTAPIRLGHTTYAVTAFNGSLGECGIFTGEISEAEAPGLCKYLMNLAGI